MVSRHRARDRGIFTGPGRPGTHNAITDVPGVRIGHTTIQRPPSVHTGVTAILIADASPVSPLPAGLFAGNGYGKLIGATQLAELGLLESPIVLTATLSAFRAADAVVTWMLERSDCADVRSFNPVVGECNDGGLSDIRARPVNEHHVRAAIDNAIAGPVPEGSVGAGTGMVALGFKAGIGTASRYLDVNGTPAILGVLVQANFGGTLRLGGQTVAPWPPTKSPDTGSCMVVVATNAPLDARQLSRVARRGVFGLGRVGASYSNGSGDYGIAVSTTVDRLPPPDAALNSIFEATLDCTEEAVVNALCAAEEVTGFDGRSIPALGDVL